MNVRVKICGITSVEDAQAAIEAGADALGLNFYKGTPRYVGDRHEAIAAVVPSWVQLVGVFVDAPADEIKAVSKRLEIIQLHGREEPSMVEAFPYRVMKAVRVRSEADLAELDRWTAAPGLMLDGAGRPGTHGGATFDWSLFHEAKRRTGRRLVLAGGLTVDNVADAVRTTDPIGVDVASGVESAPGRKDAQLMAEFVRRAKGLS